MSWHEEIAKKLESNHSDTQSVIRVGKKGAKRRTRRRQRALEKKADQRLFQEMSGETDSWIEY